MTKGKSRKTDGDAKKNDDMKGMDHSGMDMGSDKKTLVVWKAWTMEI